jgi:hypothetical protein
MMQRGLVQEAGQLCLDRQGDVYIEVERQVR